MSDEAHRQLQTIAALAIYAEKHGVVHAIIYLQGCGWTTNEALALIEQYEDFREQIKAGRLG